MKYIFAVLLWPIILGTPYGWKTLPKETYTSYTFNTSHVTASFYILHTCFPKSCLVFFYRTPLLFLTDSSVFLMQPSCCTSRCKNSPASPPLTSIFVRKNKATLRHAPVDPVQPGDQYRHETKKQHQKKHIRVEQWQVRVRMSPCRNAHFVVFFAPRRTLLMVHFFSRTMSFRFLFCYTLVPVYVYTRNCPQMKIAALRHTSKIEHLWHYWYTYNASIISITSPKLQTVLFLVFFLSAYLRFLLWIIQQNHSAVGIWTPCKTSSFNTIIVFWRCKYGCQWLFSSVTCCRFP